MSARDLPIDLSVEAAAPFFTDAHRTLATSLAEKLHDAGALLTRAPGLIARSMGAAELDLYRHLVPAAGGVIDVRALVLVREALAQRSAAADSIFAVQGLGSFPILSAGDDELRATISRGVIEGSTIGAFALTEPEAGTDVASLRTTATRVDEDWLLDGEKTLISNVGIATHYVVFATADASRGAKGIVAFYVPRQTDGITETPLYPSSPHPLGALTFAGCRVPDRFRLGDVGAGFRLAMSTLDTFRISVGAAANGMAAKALAHALAHVMTRKQFGAPLFELQQVQAMIADMMTELEEARLMVARAAYVRDTAGGATLEAAMAKMSATEKAQRIIDKAVQLHGGQGVLLGSPVEALYRDVRPLRIYEGTTEVQRVIIAKALAKAAASRAS